MEVPLGCRVCYRKSESAEDTVDKPCLDMLRSLGIGMADRKDLLCWECVCDPVLRQWLRDNGRAGNCKFCGKKRKARTLPEVARKIDGAIRAFYRPAQETRHVVEESDNPQCWADGQNAAEIIQEIADVEPAVAKAVRRYLSNAEWSGVKDGDEEYYGDAPLEHVPAYPEQFMDIWLHFEERLKHGVRFFGDRGKELLDDLFEDLTRLAGGEAIVTLEPGGGSSTFCRARIAKRYANAEAFIRDPAREIGPPPPHLARGGRMNPVGIPAFYGAFSEEVAVAEVRPPVGAFVAVGKFILLRSVQLLDVSFLPFAYHKESIFSPAYDQLRNKVGFLRRFHRRISRPVLPNDEDLEYLPTQAVAAYVANVMGLNDMIYGSTQTGAERDSPEQVDRTKCNVVLFGDAARVEAAYPAKKSGSADGAGEPDPYWMEELLPATTVAPTLRFEPEPTLVKIRSVTVEASRIFNAPARRRLVEHPRLRGWRRIAVIPASGAQA